MSLQRVAAIGMFSVCLWTATPATAQPQGTSDVTAGQPGPTQPGVLASPPIATPVVTLPEKLDGRRDIRGCPVGSDCSRPQDRLRQFEIETFGAKLSTSSPWVGDGGSPALVGQPVTKSFKKPSDYRPELAWMDSLALPDLPVRWTPRLIDYLLFYKDDPRGRSILTDWFKAQGRYRDLITSHLQAAKLPVDLLYVAMIESSYDPFDSSYAGASGLWQFMPEGAKIYGLQINRWVDERRDPLRSTVAVVAYWKDLYQRFGDWHLAMAAFNAGYGALLRSIARYNTNDYWQLCEFENGLPWETTLYVPKALAVAIIGHNRAVFGYDQVKELSPEVSQTIAVSGSVPLGVVANAAQVRVDQIKALNPQLRRGRTPPGVTGYPLRVPGALTRKLADFASDWDNYDAYVVATGQRFEDIATEFGTTTKRLRELNEIDHESEITGGVVLVVPKIAQDKREKNRERAKLSLHSSGNDQKEGEPLIVAVPNKDAMAKGKKRVFYRVVNGDTLVGVATALGVSRKALVSDNGLDDGAKLHPKMILQAFVDENFNAEKRKVDLLDDSLIVVVTRGSKEHLDLAEQRVGRVRLEYIAKGDESFESIGKRFGLTKYDMARINRKHHKTEVKAGETVIVYQVVDRSRSTRAQKQSRKSRVGRGHKGGASADSTAGKEGESAVDASSGAIEEAPTDDTDDEPVTAPQP